MVRAGYSPSVRLFEAAACATPIISDAWDGIGTLFAPGEEILLAESADEVLGALAGWSEARRRRMAAAALRRVQARHTAAHRAAELERHLREALSRRRRTDATQATRRRAVAAQLGAR
jgi:spore maturation protein CgeB